MKEFGLMDRRSRNRPKKTKAVSKSKTKQTRYECKYLKMLLGVRYNERENNKIVTLGPHKVSVSPQQQKSVIAGAYFSQPSVTFAGDFAAGVRNSEVSARRELIIHSMQSDLTFAFITRGKNAKNRKTAYHYNNNNYKLEVEWQP